MRDELYVPPPLEWSPQARPLFAPPAPRSRWKEYGRPALLFVVTAATVFLHGALGVDEGDFFVLESVQNGLILVAGVFSIMLAHEMGHYLFCRYYRVDATVPHFLPAPPLFIGFATQPAIISIVGTFGAFIRIRGPMPHRKALFDIGVAGPLAGFVVTVGVLALTLATATFVPIVEPRPSGPGLLHFPLLFDLAVRTIEVPPGMRLDANGSLVLSAWFGAFLTALNLFPVGQLDGGHMAYALLRKRSAIVSKVGFWLCIGLIYFSPSWVLWAVLLRLFGRGHPFTLDEEAPVGRVRALIGLLSIGVFVLCFHPSPLNWGTWTDMWRDLASWMGSWLT